MNAAGRVCLSKSKTMGSSDCDSVPGFAFRERPHLAEERLGRCEHDRKRTVYSPPMRRAEIAKVGMRMKVTMSSSNPRKQVRERRVGKLTGVRDGAVRTVNLLATTPTGPPTSLIPRSAGWAPSNVSLE